MIEPNPGFREALKRLDGVNLWREAMTHLRHLSDDVWNGLKLFLILNGFIIISMGALVRPRPLNRPTALVLAIVTVVGIVLTIAARYILKRHRIYYLQMLAKKSLLEDELGFYQTKFAGSETDLAFPWRLAPEVVAEIKQNGEAWIQKSIRARGTIARVQFLIYETLLALYCLIFLLAVIHV